MKELHPPRAESVPGVGKRCVPGGGTKTAPKYTSLSTPSSIGTTTTQKDGSSGSLNLYDGVPVEEVIEELKFQAPYRNKDNPAQFVIGMKNMMKDMSLILGPLYEEGQRIRDRLAVQKEAEEVKLRQAAFEDKKSLMKQEQLAAAEKELRQLLKNGFSADFLINDMLGSSWLLPNGDINYKHRWHNLNYQEARTVLSKISPDEAKKIPSTLLSYRQKKAA